MRSRSQYKIYKKRYPRAYDLQQEINLYIDFIQKHPQEIDDLLVSELQSFLLEISTHEDSNSDISQDAKKGYSTIEEGLNLSANIIEVLSFFSGISSLPILIKTISILRNIQQKHNETSTEKSPKMKELNLPIKKMKTI